MSDDVPRPGDPWDPGWEDSEEEDDLFSVPPREEGEGRGRFFRRLLGRRGGNGEDAGEDDESSSVERVYDDLRSSAEDGDGEPGASPAEVSPPDETGEIPVVASGSPVADGPLDGNETAGGDDDTGELVAIVQGPDDAEEAPPTWSVDPLVWEGDDDETGFVAEDEPAGSPITPDAFEEGNTDEAPVVDADGEEPPPAFAEEEADEVPVVDAEGEEFVAATAAFGEGIFDFDREDEITEESYFGTATREHQDLAEAIAEAAEEDTEQVAVAAAIPGLESSVVGFEDVVAAEGGTAAPPRARSDLGLRVLTGLLLAAAFVASLLWRPALVVLAVGVFVLTAGEFYGTLMRHRLRPTALFGFLGMLGASLGAVAWGVIAIPVALIVAVTVLLLFYAVVPGRADPLTGFSSTILVLAWVGGLTAFAIPIIESDRYRPLVAAVVVLVVMMDIAQYFVGRGIGRRPLAPVLSPKKTVEGLVGGIVVALALGVLIGFVEPFDMTSGLALGIGVAVFSPLGDLAVSAIKRALGVKDMGSILPGHGGLLDRIDGLVFVIPVAWATFMWAGLL